MGDASRHKSALHRAFQP
ncbi:hypothetical protein GIV20_12965 [Pseudomonas tremae]|uniref:Uncharacterized protein n=1 Tax=Pseudomonas coronafaciens pv. coronafaciens TaxID=235275 RepID=A0AAE6QN00_9PSED|nr:hypothetical protein [Pseudomonas tremae]MCF5809003.1 hypothetical protein [Pseudomonas tremae]QGT84786.1 hypothetical protein GMO17_26275 [Pseudomonas coronafaciens pv. coronafaciens]